ncbi:MAG: NAD-dependent epimerase/dehydratase family protein [Nanoarchaeota archaeon]|nr:NAD-dependent epimerase/dehydratase family protein [Nanoarchaeota archaeon]
MKRAVVCGAGGFVGSHLVEKLKKEGYWVRGVGRSHPKFSETKADEFKILDLRNYNNCRETVEGGIEEIYQLAADMGGVGIMELNAHDIMRNNSLIDTNMIHVATKEGVERYFFSSSVCVYRDMREDEPEMSEEEAYPAMPHNEYGWQKLFAERMITTYAKKYGIKARIGRFGTCYGPEGIWRGGREKVISAICRKVAEARDGGEIEVWGDGTAVRSFLYIDDMVDAIYRLMHSELNTPTNINSEKYITINGLVDLTAKIAEKNISKKNIEGPVGVQSRNFSNKKIYSIGWKPKVSLERGMKDTYSWVEKQVKKDLKISDLFSL